MYMSDYGRGALHALFWVKGMLERRVNVGDVQEEVDRAIRDLRCGIATDFRERLADQRF